MATIRESEQRRTSSRTVTADSWRRLSSTCAAYLNDAALDVVRRAYALAARAHAGAKRYSGEPYIEHPLAVAQWLADRHVGVDCIAAALLHDVVEDTPVTLQRIRNRFGPVIASLVDGVTKFEAVELPDEEDDELTRLRERKQRQQAETLRKLLLAMAEDPRVALIKLADRLHNLRTLGAMRPDRQIAKAHETLEIYAPLADRLGLSEIKYEIQDLALSYIDPDRYRWLTEHIAAEVEARKQTTDATKRALEEVLAQHGIDATVTPQVKHLASVQQRLEPTGLDVSELQDLITFRVLVQTRRDCYAALQAIHSQWQQLDSRLRDYIGWPKLNGYQSLHTTVFGMEGLFDVYIRTFEMQHIADLGPILVAATRDAPRPDRGQTLQWIEQVRAWQRELSLSATEFYDAVREDLFRDQIFVFTPKGEVKDLAPGATVLDMAYRIHTQLGEHCAGARVTGSDNIVRHEGREYRLRSGEIVQVLTDESTTPDIDWLHIAHTRHAREAIAHYLHAHGIPTDEDGLGDAPIPPELLRTARLAQCCEPWPDDELVCVRARHGLVVHRQGCYHVPETRPAAHVRWDALNPAHYRVSLDIIGRDRSGLMHDVAAVIAQANINVVRLGARAIGSRVRANIRVTLDIKHPEQFRSIVQRLQAVEGVVTIARRERLPHREEQGTRPSHDHTFSHTFAL
jgi:(p)ppGpp synthase/HD superfamily hydrolase